MRQNALLPERKSAIPPSKRAHTGKVVIGESNPLTASSSPVIMAKNCGSRSHWTAVIMKPCTASTGGYDSETVQDVMPGAVEHRFGSSLPTSPVEWLTGNGSACRSHQTRQYAARKETRWQRAS